ncbi:MAG: GNAT family N-acyltransferase [Gammaproteobacteria bacterium]
MATPFNEVSNITLAEQQNRFSVFLADSHFQRHQCYKLRYDVFANEMGAEVRGTEPGIDKDRFDDACHHLAVYDNYTNELIATTRLLDNEGRARVGIFYSETEFDLSNILSDGCRFMEVGRTCIHPEYRRGSALAMLWQGIARLVVEDHIDYLIGCASIPMSAGDKYLSTLMTHIRARHYAPESLRVRPLVPLRLEQQDPMPDDIIPPTLLKAYLRQGAMICGEPYWDAAFGVADVFVLLDCDQISSRYVKRFIERL